MATPALLKISIDPMLWRRHCDDLDSGKTTPCVGCVGKDGTTFGSERVERDVKRPGYAG